MKKLSLVLIILTIFTYSVPGFSGCVNGCCYSDHGTKRSLDPRMFGDNAQVDTGIFEDHGSEEARRQLLTSVCYTDRANPTAASYLASFCEAAEPRIGALLKYGRKDLTPERLEALATLRAMIEAACD